MIPILILVTLVWLAVKSEIKTRKWMKAFDLHNDMFNKYIELVDDSLVGDYKLKEWLPIFEEVDRICARDCPDMKFDSLSLKIRRRINNQESIED